MRRNVLKFTIYCSLFARLLAILTRYSLKVGNSDFNFICFLELVIYFFNDVGPYHMEISPLIWVTNQWTVFYMIEKSVIKELRPKELRS